MKLDDQAACWQRKYNQGKSQGSSVLTKHQEMRHSWFGCELWEAACPPLATAGTTPRETEELRSWLNAKTLQGMACLLCWLMPCKHYRDPKERRMVRDHCVPQIKPAVVTQKRVTVSLQHSSSGNSLSLLLQAFNTWPLWEPTCLLDMKKSGWSMFHTCETKWRLLPTAFLPIILSEAFVVTVSTHISPSPCGAWLFHGNQRPVPYSHQHPGVLGGRRTQQSQICSTTTDSELSACQHYVVSRMKTEAHSSHPSASGDADTQAASESVPYANPPQQTSGLQTLSP